jgi:hypothetical protein
MTKFYFAAAVVGIAVLVAGCFDADIAAQVPHSPTKRGIAPQLLSLSSKTRTSISIT